MDLADGWSSDDGDVSLILPSKVASCRKRCNEDFIETRLDRSILSNSQCSDHKCKHVLSPGSGKKCCDDVSYPSHSSLCMSKGFCNIEKAASCDSALFGRSFSVAATNSLESLVNILSSSVPSQLNLSKRYEEMKYVSSFSDGGAETSRRSGSSVCPSVVAHSIDNSCTFDHGFEQAASSESDEISTFRDRFVTPYTKRFVAKDVRTFDNSFINDDSSDGGLTDLHMYRKLRNQSLIGNDKITNRLLEEELCTSIETSLSLAEESYQFLELGFMESLNSKIPAGSVRCQRAVIFVEKYKKTKLELAAYLFEILNDNCFQNKIPSNFKIQFNSRLLKTAGYCYTTLSSRTTSFPTGSSFRGARIELSNKVVDCAERLRDTLVHELCHAAAWIISGYRGGHGPVWKRWAEVVRLRYPVLPPVTRCHKYDINFKFTYSCIDCGESVGRHSKSIDVSQQMCVECGGTYRCFQTANPSSVPRPLNVFASFVKSNYRLVKKDGLKHADVMKTLANMFSAAKVSN